MGPPSRFRYSGERYSLLISLKGFRACRLFQMFSARGDWQDGNIINFSFGRNFTNNVIVLSGLLADELSLYSPSGA